MTTNLYQILEYSIEEKDGLWLKDSDGEILCEVIHQDIDTNDQMYDAGFTPLDMQLGYWISDFDSKEIFSSYL